MKNSQPIAGFWQFRTSDRSGREIFYYLDKGLAGVQAEVPLFLAVSIQGSGCDSVFRQTSAGASACHQGRLRDVGDGRYLTLVVEKPGVSLYDESERPGSSLGCSEQFLETFTLESWAEAIRAAVEDVQRCLRQPFKRTLLVGHSEGGQVAAYIAAQNTWVTHVAIIGTPGLNHVFELCIADQRRGDTVNIRDIAQQVLRVADELQIAVESSNREEGASLIRGHTRRRWASFLKTSTLACLLERLPNLYIVHGLTDDKVSALSSAILYLELMHMSPRPILELIPDVTHGLRDLRTGDDGPLRLLLARIINWFLTDEFADG